MAATWAGPGLFDSVIVVEVGVFSSVSIIMQSTPKLHTVSQDVAASRSTL